MKKKKEYLWFYKPPQIRAGLALHLGNIETILLEQKTSLTQKVRKLTFL